MRKGFSALALALLAMGSAFAQHASTTDGRGTYTLSGTSHDIREVTVIISLNNKVQIGVVGNGRFNFNGECTDVRGSTYTVNIGPANQPFMKGTIVTAGNYVRSISLSPVVESSRTSLSFFGTRASTGSEQPGNPGNGNIQNPIQLKQTIRGSGDFNYTGNRNNLGTVEVDIRRDGRVFVVFNGDRRYTIASRYTSVRGSTIPLTIYDGLNRSNVTGNGSITLSRDLRNIERVSLSGSADRDRFSLNFTKGSLSLDEIVDGRGNVEVGRDRQETRRVRVIINRNGSFTIRNEDSWRIEFSGTWREDRDGVLTLTVNRIPGRSGVSGNGTVRLENNSDRVSSVDLSGRANGEYFSLSIRN